MKSILYTFLIMQFGLMVAHAQNPNDPIIKMPKIELKQIENNIVSDFNFSVPCITAQPPLENHCESMNLFMSDRDENSKGALRQWFSKSVKATDPLKPSSDLARGDFDLKGPGKTALFCTKCNTGIVKELINKSASGVDDKHFKNQLKDAYLQKQAENFASRFQTIRNNINYLQVDSSIHGLTSDDVGAIAGKCNLDNMEMMINQFIEKQEKLAAKTGNSNCPALKNVDVNKFFKVFRRDSKNKEKRLESFKEASDKRSSSITSNVETKYSTSCVDEALFQKAWGGFTPAEAVNLILHTPSEKLNEKDFPLILKNSILNDPKYNFMMTDPKQAPQLNILISSLLKEVYIPLMGEYKKQKAKIEDDGGDTSLSIPEFVKSLDPLLEIYQVKAASALNNFDKGRLNDSLNHLKAECDALVGSHLEAVICHDPPEVDLTDLDLIANLKIQPSLEECIYENRYNVDGIQEMTPFCAKFLQNYCVSDQQTSMKNLSVEDKQYRKVLGAAHMQQRNFTALKTKSLGSDPDYMKAVDSFEKNVCSKMIADCKKQNPELKQDSREFRVKLEGLTKEYLSTQKASDHYNAGDEVVRSLVDYLDSEKEKYIVAKKEENKDMSPEQYKSIENIDPTVNSYGGGSSDQGNVIEQSDDEESPVYIGVNGAGSGLEDDGIVESNGENIVVQEDQSTNQSNFVTKPTINNYSTTPLPIRSSNEIKKDEKTLESNKNNISSLKKQLEDKKESLGSNYKSDPDYIAKEKRLKELEEKTRDLERKLLAEKDQRIKELEKQLAGKSEKDKDYKKLYQELQNEQSSRNNLVAAGTGVNAGNNILPSGVFANNNGNTPTISPTATSNGQNSNGYQTSSNNVSSGSGNSSNTISSSSGSSSSGSYVTTQSSKPSDVPVITLTTEEFKLINNPNVENVRKAVENILKKHNGSVIGNRLYVQTTDDKGQVIYQSIDLKVLKVGTEEKKVIVAKKEEKKIEKKTDKSPRKPSASVEELNKELEQK